jgi:hypothetical protein
MKRFRMKRARLSAEDARELACEPEQCGELDVEHVSMRLDDQLGGLIISQPISASIDSIRLPATSVRLWKVVKLCAAFPFLWPSNLNRRHRLPGEYRLSGFHGKNWPDLSQNH